MHPNTGKAIGRDARSPGGGAGGVGSGVIGAVLVVANGTDGGGPGGGGHGVGAGNPSARTGGGGGSFGSAGRNGGNLGAAPAGGTYGDLTLVLEGGSGGGGGGGHCCTFTANIPGRGGGGGGGRLEIGALGLIDLVGGTILANGGDDAGVAPGTAGGGGSGGWILLHAFDIGLDVNSLLSARGGDSNIASGAGCGGGGRIALVTNTAGAVSDTGASVDIAGVFACPDPGSILVATDPNVGVAPLVVAVPEPDTLALFGLGLAGLTFMAWRRGARA